MKIKKVWDYKWINIFIDSNSYEDYSIFEKLEWYYWEEKINIYELYKERQSNILPKYKVEYLNDFYWWWVKFEYLNDRNKTWSSHAMLWKDDIRLMTKCIFWKVDDYKIKLTENLFISEHFVDKEYLTLFITNENSIIKKKDEIYKRIKNLNVVDLNIAEEILWLFFRCNWNYRLFKQKNFTFNVNEWLYYLSSYRYYNSYFLMDHNHLSLTSEILFKWESIIKTLDEIWFLFYWATNNDTSFDIKYYFYHYLVLICWIYDKIAMYINRLYKLELNEINLSLNSKWNWYDNLIKKLEDKEKLINILETNKNNIDLAYKMRNLVVHTEWFNPININWDIIALKIDNDIKSLLLSVDKSINKIKSTYNNWIIKDLIIEKEYFLIPFIFSKFYFKLFYELLNSLFKELWNDKFIDTLDKKSDFYKNLKVFEEYTLKLDLN